MEIYSGQPETGDAAGAAFFDAATGNGGSFVIEREDGWVDVNITDYTGNLPDREIWAVSHAVGRVLDVGAGAGRGALALQGRGQDVLALDVSPGAIKACRARGVKDAYLGTIDQAVADGMAGSFNSALLLGNNLGLLGSREAAHQFLEKLGALLGPEGLIVGTGSDPYQTSDPIHLEYHEWNNRRNRMAGQNRIRVRYQRMSSGWFDWLAPSPNEVAELARPVGWEISEFRSGPGSLYALVLARSAR